MIWNDHRLIDVGNHIALAAMVDLFTSVHFELQDGFGWRRRRVWTWWEQRLGSRAKLALRSSLPHQGS